MRKPNEKFVTFN